MTRRMLRRNGKALRVRRGTTTLEFAFILPVFLIFVFGLMTVGHYRMSADLLKGACRDAARYGAMQDVTTAMARERFRQRVAAGMNVNLVTLSIKDLGAIDANGGAMPKSTSDFNSLPDIELANAPSRRLFAVRAEVNYNKIAVIPVNWIPWAKNMSVTAQVFTRHE